MDQVTTDKKLYTDYKDDKMTQVTNLKLKTTAGHMSAWVTANRGLFPDPNCWDYKPKCTTLRVKESTSSSLTVKFHLTTGVVLIQGSMYSTLKDKYFASLQSKVSDLCAENSMTDNCHERHHSDDDTHRKQPADGTCDIPHSEGREISEVDDINCDITTINSDEINDSMDLSNDEINANMTEIKQAQNQNDSSDQPKWIYGQLN